MAHPSLIPQGCYEVQVDIIMLSKWQLTCQCALVVSTIRERACAALSWETQARRPHQWRVFLHGGVLFPLAHSVSFLVPLMQNCVSGSPKERADSTDSWNRGSQISLVLWKWNNWFTGFLYFFLLLVLACQQIEKQSVSVWHRAFRAFFRTVCCRIRSYSFGSPFGSPLPTCPGKNFA